MFVVNVVSTVANGAHSFCGSKTMARAVPSLFIRRVLILVSLLTAAEYLLPSAAAADSRTLFWDAPSDLSSVAGYRLKVGTVSGQYTRTVDAGNHLSAAVGDLQRGRIYYLAVVAYNAGGLESATSNQIALDLRDTDNDGLDNASEADAGTDPHNPDSDGDGVSDGQEVADGTSPLDRGSYHEQLGNTVCAEWNSNLDMVNVLEHSNIGEQPLTITTKLFDYGGEQRGDLAFALQPSGEFDVLVHELAGMDANSYGQVCSTYSGEEGALDGRMVYYRPDTADGSWSDSFQFALAMPFTSGIAGEQFVTFNTFQPSLAAGDASHLVANWIQLTNLSTESVQGTLTFYEMDGSTLAAEEIELPGNSRRDFSAHQFGPSHVGTVAWRPRNSTARFQLRNTRYLYANAGERNVFDGAVQIQGQAGNGMLQAAPITTEHSSGILELSNVTADTVHVDVHIYNTEGTPLFSGSIPLPPFASFHLIADPILLGQAGTVTAKADKTASLFATVMQYDRRADGGINYLYALPLTEAGAAAMKGTYNTFLSQEGELLLADTTGTAQTATFSLVRADGSTTVRDISVTVPAHGLAQVNINELEAADVYGVLRLQTAAPHSLVGWIFRKKGGEFVIPIPLR
jgi:hypothetical protein